MKNKNQAETKQDLELGNPLDLSNAIVSTIIYVGVLLLVYYSKLWLGERGLVVSGILSGLADVDAIAIALSEVIGTVPQMLPVYILLAAMISNTLLKMTLALVKSHRSVRKRIVTGLALIAASAIVYLIMLIAVTQYESF
jgi:uncharacterized membrane protein (DUF4010 family)